MIGKLVLTGAAGRLGTQLRAPLAQMARELVSTDLADEIGPLHPGERYQRADLARYDEVASVVADADMVVHFGAIPDEAPFEDILGPNIVGAYHVWEAAYRTGARRVIYASSIHAVGMYPKQERIGVEAPHRPDTFYGLSKCFAEDLGRLYWERRGLEAVHLRILSCTEEAQNARALGSWLSYGDLVRLVTRAIDTPTVGCSVVYGVSDNDRAPVDNSGAGHLGYRPQDNAEAAAEALLAAAGPGDPTDAAQMHHGGPFAAIDLGSSGLAAIKALSSGDDT